MSNALGTSRTGPAHLAQRRSLRSRLALPLALWAVVFVVHATSTNNMIADSARSIYVASEMVHHGDVKLNRYTPEFGTDTFALQRHGNDTLSLFPWAPPMMAAPLVVAWDVLHDIRGGQTFDQRISTTEKTSIFQVVSMSYVVAFTAVVLYFVSRRLLRSLQDRRRDVWAFGVALVFAFGTSAWTTASRSLWQHGPSMLCLSLAVLFALRAEEDPRNLLGLGAALAASFMMRPTDAIAVGAFSVWVLLRFGKRSAWYVLGALPLTVVLLVVDHANYGTWLQPYYRSTRLGSSQDGYQVHFLTALAGNLVSPGRGVFVYMPVFLLAFAGVAITLRSRSFNGLDAVLLTTIVGVWIAISLFPQWWGGDSYGPRLFSDMVPFFVVLCLPVVDRLGAPSWAAPGVLTRPRMASIVGVLVLASFLVHVQGAYLTSSWCWNDTPVSVDKDNAKLWSWSNPQFLAGFRGLWDGVPHELTREGVLKNGCPPGSAPG